MYTWFASVFGTQSGLRWVLHGESPKRSAPPRNTKDRKHPQSTQTIFNRHNSQTKHQAPSKEQPKCQNAQHQPAQQRARLQHSNLQPSLRTPSRVIARSSQPTQPNAKHRRAEPHYSTDTTRTAWEVRCQEELVDSQGRTACFWGWEGGKGRNEGRRGRAKAREWGG